MDTVLLRSKEEIGRAMSKRYFVRNAAGAYLRQNPQTEWTPSQSDATAFSDMSEAERARRDDWNDPRTLWDAEGRQLVARQIGGEWFATAVRGVGP